MPRFADMSISAFLDAVSSAEPTPGGGTAAAISGAIGVSLLMMVAGLPRTRRNTDAERARLAQARQALQGIRERLVALADRDSEAYDKVMAAYRLPKTTDQEKAARREAIQQAMRAATEAPLDILRALREAAVHGRTVAHCGNPSAGSDVRVGLELIEAAAAGAAANIDVNLAGIDDPKYQSSTASTMIDLSNALTEDVAAARAALKDAAQAT
jgi:glutamate formiminotransferase/formiminotetrahydrofolate cyclodeaminase